jgi:nucleoside-diphosphate-sugar epimerase
MQEDLEYILEHTSSIWDELKGARIFITGGTGFIGTWLLETLAFANRQYDLQLSVTVLTRDSTAFAKKAPDLVQNPIFIFLTGDVQDFVFPKEKFTHIIHAATEASAKLNNENPQLMLNTIIAGTRHTLEFAAAAHCRKFLLLSSGAVYGKQPADIMQVTEEYLGSVISHSVYGRGKQAAERLCLEYAARYSIEIKIARCFTFVGPHLPLDKHFAIGNFIRDGLLGKDIQVNSDGTSYRSYQYVADLVIWLLQIWIRGESGLPYNVGSDEAISIAELAHTVANSFVPARQVHIAELTREGNLAERYIPSTQRAKRLLNLTNYVSLPNAIQKTIAWHMKYKERVND